MRPLHIIHLQQDDPKKCTARMLARRELAIVHQRIGGPYRGILLDPLCGKVLGPEDKNLPHPSVIALDCSWKSIEPSIEELDRTRRLHHRTLPLLLAASQSHGVNLVVCRLLKLLVQPSCYLEKRYRPMRCCQPSHGVNSF